VYIVLLFKSLYHSPHDTYSVDSIQ